MSEASMYEELSLWRDYIALMLSLAIEMESGEQIPENVSATIAHMFNSVDDGGEYYSIDFQHPSNPKRKLVFEFNAFVSEGE